VYRYIYIYIYINGSTCQWVGEKANMILLEYESRVRSGGRRRGRFELFLRVIGFRGSVYMRQSYTWLVACELKKVPHDHEKSSFSIFLSDCFFYYICFLFFDCAAYKISGCPAPISSFTRGSLENWRFALSFYPAAISFDSASSDLPVTHSTLPKTSYSVIEKENKDDIKMEKDDRRVCFQI
jgi:hypothetical protein